MDLTFSAMHFSFYCLAVEFIADHGRITDYNHTISFLGVRLMASAGCSRLERPFSPALLWTFDPGSTVGLVSCPLIQRAEPVCSRSVLRENGRERVVSRSLRPPARLIFPVGFLLTPEQKGSKTTCMQCFSCCLSFPLILHRTWMVLFVQPCIHIHVSCYAYFCSSKYK